MLNIGLDTGTNKKSDEIRPHLLLVEDDEIDVMFFEREMEKSPVDISLKVARDGSEALDILEKDNIRPCVIVTDLNMPGMSGFEFIDKIRAEKRLQDSVIFVFSSSELEEDIKLSYEKHVAGYISKQASIKTMYMGVRLVLDYCDNVLLPH